MEHSTAEKISAITLFLVFLNLQNFITAYFKKQYHPFSRGFFTYCKGGDVSLKILKFVWCYKRTPPLWTTMLWKMNIYIFASFTILKVHPNTQLRVFQQTKKLSSSLWPKLVLPTGIRRTEHPVRQELSFLILKTFSTAQLWWQSVFLVLQVGHEEVLSRLCHSTANLFMPVE